MALTKIKLDSMVTGNLPDANIPNSITVDTASAAPASGLTGNTLASGVTASSLTSVGSLTGLTIAGTGTNAAPTLAIDNSSSSSYIHSIEALGANMTQGQNNIINLGKIGSTKNSAVIGYKWDSSGSNNNLLTFEHWGTGPLQTIDGLGNVTFLGNGSDQTIKWHSGSAYVNAKLDVRQLAIAFSGTDKVTSNTSGDFTFAEGVAINGASLGSHKLVVDNGTTSLNRGNSGGDILDVRGLNASQFKVTTTSATFAGVGNFTRDASGFNTYIFNDNGAGEGLHIKVKGNDAGQTGRYLIKAEGYGSSGAFTNNFLVDTDGNTTIGGNIITSSSSTLIAPNTSDGSDNKRINIAGGGSNDITRGAVVEVFGNEYGDSRAGQCHISGMVRMGNGSRTTGDDQHRTLSLGGRPSSNTYVTLGFDSGNSYRGALDFKADSGDFSYYVNNGGWLQSFSINNSRDISFFGSITSDQSGTSDYANTAFLTQDGNNNNGVKISHGGGNGKLEIYGGNQSRTQFYANQITANVNGLEIKTTDAQTLVFGTNNTTRMTIDSNGRAEFKKLIYRVNTEQQNQTNLMSCYHWDHPGTTNTSFFDFNPVLDLGLHQYGGSFFLKISGWQDDRYFGMVTYRANGGGSSNISSGAIHLDTIINNGYSISVSAPSGNLVRIQLSGHHNNDYGWDMMAFSAPYVT